MTSWIGAIIAALLGASVAFLNYRLTKRAAESSGSPVRGLFGFLPLIRTALGAGLLALCYFAGPLTPWDRIWLLGGAAFGLTVPLFFFTFLLTKQANGGTANGTGKESEDPDRKGEEQRG